MEKIIIQGARIHNLKNINLAIPKYKLVVITGISGSGKSSLAFDILFEEGKNQYLNSVGILAGLDNEDRFDVLEGIGPAVAVQQNTIRQNNPRSTVGTRTGILNKLALIYACEGKNPTQSKQHFLPREFLYTSTDGMCIQCQGKGSYFDVNLEHLVPEPDITLRQVYERLKITSGFLGILRKKYGEYFESAFWQLPEDVREKVVYGTYERGIQSYCLDRFFRNAYERGEDVSYYYERVICPVCHGERINEDVNSVTLNGKRFGELGLISITELKLYILSLEKEEISQFSRNVIRQLKKEIEELISFRLGHLSLYRELSTLSGGEIQRIFLHLHIESRLDSLIYVFDEPMSGLHPSEKHIMIQAVKNLRDIGNTVIIVEHDKEMIKCADQIIEIGPKAGVEGGSVVFQGNYTEYLNANTLLSNYVAGISLMPDRCHHSRLDNNNCLSISHANIHCLKDISADIPLNSMVGIAGLSGSGKSSFIINTLLARLSIALKYGSVSGLTGYEKINGFIQILQDPIGRNANSTPVSYVGVWDKIRDIFASQPKAKMQGMSSGDFSFHLSGACQTCNGSGYEKIELTANFTVNRVCPTCNGKRFNEKTLSISYKEKSISDILEMNISEAVLFYKNEKKIVKPLMILEQMGMGYLTLGQPTSSLSGGEAQRIKLAKELGKRKKGNILYVLDEPSTGLSLYDIALLLKILDKLVEDGNSVIMIEHNIELLKSCDFLIELGPEGGENGGEIIASGTPSELSRMSNSKTGGYLR